MAGIITQLTHLALTTRYQVIKMAQYIGESKDRLIVNDWKLVSRKTKYTPNLVNDFVTLVHDFVYRSMISFTLISKWNHLLSSNEQKQLH